MNTSRNHPFNPNGAPTAKAQARRGQRGPSPACACAVGAASRTQRGAALVIGLILLLILTILAVTGMGTAATELVMAGNEQARTNASHAAAAGVEEAIAGIGSVPTTLAGDPVPVGPLPVPGADASVTSPDTYTTLTRYIGIETSLPQSSANKFVGLHYVIRSTGTSARRASDTQVQGVLVVAQGGGSDSFGKIGSGLGP